ncbi:MAG: tRNA pseudouridine(55) synthase TruB [Lysobacterales bacterium]
MHQVLLLDKPLGLGSNAALQRVRWLLGKPRAGHTGTLDPLATGMLPICLGEATKFAGYLLSERKCYRASVHLGVATVSGDADGEALAERPVPPLSAARITEAMAAFIGRIRQRPPIYSALKRDGVPLYRLARAGVEVEVAEREVTIYRFELLGFDATSLEFEVECGSGTYIRSLGPDLALALGTVGHLSALRRLWVAPFAERPMVSLAQIEQLSREAWRPGAEDAPPWLLPIDQALANLPQLRIDSAACRALGFGQAVAGFAPADQPLRLYDPERHFLGLGRVGDDGLLRVQRLLTPPSGVSKPPS